MSTQTYALLFYGFPVEDGYDGTRCGFRVPLYLIPEDLDYLDFALYIG